MLVMGILFGDVYHYSALADQQMPLFVEHFLGLVGDLVRNSPYAPVSTNTWGDGLYFLFRDTRDAGLFALALNEEVTRKDWGAVGLRPELTLRIGLHAGPLFSYDDPVTGQRAVRGAARSLTTGPGAWPRRRPSRARRSQSAWG
jgi:class 3 adenylate cyclase